jgi:D-alanine-D-alanine ligase
MSIQVNKNWWKDLFDETYLLTDARSVCDEELTVREVNFLEKILKLEKAWPILDLCGGHGRHALELSRRGFLRVTTLDYSKYLLYLGKQRAGQENLNTLFILGDARCTGLCDESFQVIIIMGSSFGYFVQEEENQKILTEAFRLLVPAGKLFLDIPDRDYVLREFKCFTRHKIRDDIDIFRTRELEQNIIYCRERVTSASKGFIREKNYCTRLYGPEKISRLLLNVGFSKITYKNDFMCREAEGDYGTMTSRMVVVAEK